MPPPCGIIPRLLLAWICTKAFRNRPDIRRLVGGCAAAICRLQAPTAPEPGDLERPTAEEPRRRGCGEAARPRAAAAGGHCARWSSRAPVVVSAWPSGCINIGTARMVLLGSASGWPANRIRPVRSGRTLLGRETWRPASQRPTVRGGRESTEFAAERGAVDRVIVGLRRSEAAELDSSGGTSPTHALRAACLSPSVAARRTGRRRQPHGCPTSVKPQATPDVISSVMRFVLDTNVIVAGLRSP